jgi:Ca-activated chloride channel family protein
MMVLDWPWALAALPLPLLARRLPPARPRLGKALRLPFYAELVDLEGGGRGGSGRLRLTLAWLAWALLVLAAARPQWLGEPVSLPVSGRDLMLAVDVSGSMQQEDYRLGGRPADRLDVVKAVVGRFIERRQGDRLGLILFGSRAYLQTPLTYDGDTVRTLLDESVIGLAGRETAIGDAIALALKRLKQQPEDNRVLILLTDGANTAGNIAPLNAAQLAAKAKVRIYTIGIGGGPVGLSSPFGMLMQQGSNLDPATLKAIAKESGGRYFQATDTDQLEQVYDELDRLEPSIRDTRSYRPMQALFMWPAGAALVISLCIGLLNVGWRKPTEFGIRNVEFGIVESLRDGHSINEATPKAHRNSAFRTSHSAFKSGGSDHAT